jgi:hypothetical protein
MVMLGRFACVLDSRPDELADVLVRERVEDVLAVAAVLYDSLASKEAQLLRESGHLGAHRLRQLGHANLSVTEALDQAQAMLVAGGTKESGRPPKRLIRNDAGTTRVSFLVRAAFGALGSSHHFTK